MNTKGRFGHRFWKTRLRPKAENLLGISAFGYQLLRKSKSIPCFLFIFV